MTNHRTRSTACPYIGHKCETIPQLKLPLISDVLRYFVFLRDLTPNKNSEKTRDIAKEVCKAVCEIWKRASVSTCREDSIVDRIEKLYTVTYQKKVRFARKRINDKKELPPNTITTFDQLFDVARCKCKTMEKVCVTCKQTKEDKVFLLDQRGPRQLIISNNVDRKTTQIAFGEIEKNERTQNRKLKRSASGKKQKGKSKNDSIDSENEIEFSDSEAEHEHDSSLSKDPDYEEPKKLKKTKKADHEILAIAAIQCGASVKQTTVISNAALKANNVDKQYCASSIQYGKMSVRIKALKIAKELLNAEPIIGLYFDKRKDKTATRKIRESGSKSHEFEQEDHYTLIGYQTNYTKPFFICSLYVPTTPKNQRKEDDNKVTNITF